MATSKTIEIAKIDDEFHYKPFNHKLETVKIPILLFDEYIETRTKYLAMREEIESYFTPRKMDEGEIYKLSHR